MTIKNRFRCYLDASSDYSLDSKSGKKTTSPAFEKTKKRLDVYKTSFDFQSYINGILCAVSFLGNKIIAKTSSRTIVNDNFTDFAFVPCLIVQRIKNCLILLQRSLGLKQSFLMKRRCLWSCLLTYIVYVKKTYPGKMTTMSTSIRSSVQTPASCQWQKLSAKKEKEYIILSTI